MADGRYRALERGQGMDYAPSLDAPARAALLAGAVDGTEMVEILGDSRDHVDSVAAAYAALVCRHRESQAAPGRR